MELTFASHRIVLDFAAIGDTGEKDELSMRVTARVFDADGAIVAIEPEDVKWKIDDPWIREHAMPCKGANGVPPPCIEFGPIKRGYTDATLAACFQGTICDLVLVPDPPVWKMVSAGLGHHACALKTDGRAYCWGQGGHGEIGARVAPECTETFFPEGEAETRPWACAPVPVQVQCPDGPCNFIDISAGFEHTCAVDDEQNAWCWGGNFIGEPRHRRGRHGQHRALESPARADQPEVHRDQRGHPFHLRPDYYPRRLLLGLEQVRLRATHPGHDADRATLVNVPVNAHSIDTGWSHVCARAS